MHGAEVSPYITCAEVCRTYRIPRRDLVEMVAAGEFPRGVQVSPRRLRFLRSEVEAWAAERTVGVADATERDADADDSIRQSDRPRPDGGDGPPPRPDGRGAR